MTRWYFIVLFNGHDTPVQYGPFGQEFDAQEIADWLAGMGNDVRVSKLWCCKY